MTNESDDKDKYDVPISGHDYDGILELDNPLPNWWVYVFLGTIIFGFLYWIHYFSGSGLTNEEKLARDLQEIEAQQTLSQSEEQSFGESEIRALMDRPELMAQARQSYEAKCAACHGLNGEGGIGASFQDGEWIHGGDLVSIQRIVAEGVLDKGMPPWRGVLSTDEVAQMAAFVKSFEK